MLWISAICAILAVAFSFLPMKERPVKRQLFTGMGLFLGIAALGAAGLAGIGSLWSALRRLVPDRGRAAALAAVWVGAYAFVGTQLGWMLRPFVGSPFYPVVFLREDALDRNFYEFVLGEVVPFLFGFE